MPGSQQGKISGNSESGSQAEMAVFSDFWAIRIDFTVTGMVPVLVCLFLAVFRMLAAWFWPSFALFWNIGVFGCDFP